MINSRSAILLVSLLSLTVCACAQFDLDGSRWSVSGTADLHLRSVLDDSDYDDVAQSVDCSVAQPFANDENPSTLSLTIDLGALSGGTIPPGTNVTATGTLNTTTGVFSVRANQTGLNILVRVNVNGVEIDVKIVSVDYTLAGTVSGDQTCFIAGKWRKTGGVMLGNPATSGGIVRGVLPSFLNLPVTITIDDNRWNGSLCECPGVTISGRVALQHYLNDPADLPAVVTVRNGASVDVYNVALGTGGTYSITYSKPGDVEVYAKVTHWLTRKRSANTTGGNVSNLDFLLANGDADPTDAVDDADLTTIILEYGNSNPPSNMADLDGSGQVDDADITIAIMNFGLAGDI